MIHLCIKVKLMMMLYILFKCIGLYLFINSSTQINTFKINNSEYLFQIIEDINKRLLK